jgi:hypothetical protein
VEAPVQLQCVVEFLGALLEDDHLVTVAWNKILCRYERVDARLHKEIDSEYGSHLGTAIFVFHLQLILHNWFDFQMQTEQRFKVPAPDFAQRIKVFERQNNLHWLPSINNVPALLALRVAHRSAVANARTATAASMEYQ